MYQWYSRLQGTIRWNGNYSNSFCITRGTRQGYVISPFLFNIFIDDFLKELDKNTSGLNIGEVKYNSFAYADDVTLFSSTTTGLQNLIIICTKYANEWRFRYGWKKSKCMTVGSATFLDNINWYLDDKALCTTDHLEILGFNFTKEMKSDVHIEKRSSACRRSIFQYVSAGMSYPGLSTDVKLELWEKVGLPTLLYGSDVFNINKSQMKRIDATQSNIIKQVLGFRKRSLNSHLLESVGLNRIRIHFQDKVKSLLYKASLLNGQYSDLCRFMISKFIVTGATCKSTLIDRLVSCNLSPLQIYMSQLPCNDCDRPTSSSNSNVSNDSHKVLHDGVLDSLRYLVFHKEFNKLGFVEHTLARLMVNAF